MVWGKNIYLPNRKNSALRASISSSSNTQRVNSVKMPDHTTQTGVNPDYLDRASSSQTEDYVSEMG